MKLLKSTIYILIVSLFFACGSSNTTVTQPKPPTPPKKVVVVEKPKEYVVKKTLTNNPNTIEFNVIQLNDVYEIAPIQGGKFGGMARVETIHKKLLEENPNTFIMLAGDFLNPSLLGTLKVDGDRLRGKQMVDVMNYMNFDLVAFGNHEFDLSSSDLQKRLNESNFEWVSANVMHNKGGRNFYFEKVVNGRKYPVNDAFVQEITDADGTKISLGVISVCIPSNPKSYVSYGDIYIEAERSYYEIKNQTDVVLGLTHLEIEQDRNVARMLPNLSLIMGGHEHTNNYETIGNVKIAKADANAKTVYIHRIIHNTITKETTVDSELVTIDDSIPEDKEVGAVVNKWQKILNNKIKEIITNPDEVIYTATTPLEARDTPIRSAQTNMGEVITKAMANAYGNLVDCAFVNGGSIRIDDVLEGEINAVDIFRVLPYGGSVFKVQLQGNLLRDVLEYGETKGRGEGSYLQRHNCNKIDGEWQVQGMPIDNTKIYTVAVSDYLLKGFDIPILKEGYSGVIDVYKPLPTENAYDIRKAVIEYLKML